MSSLEIIQLIILAAATSVGLFGLLMIYKHKQKDRHQH